MGWLYESIKRRHREEGIREGELQRVKVLREWYIAEENAGTLGTDDERPPPFFVYDGDVPGGERNREEGGRS